MIHTVDVAAVIVALLLVMLAILSATIFCKHRIQRIQRQYNDTNEEIFIEDYKQPLLDSPSPPQMDT